MNHQPFEDWLLNDKPLTAAEKRELDMHMRTCLHCTALSATGLALRSARAVPPAPGFALRFQERLAAQKVAERRRRLWGILALVITGLTLFGWLTSPYLTVFFDAPIEWLTTGLGYFLFILTSLQAFREAILVMARVIPEFIPPYVWMMIISAAAGLGLLWIVSIWRFARAPQGATA